jgi:hypothetical protein
MDNNLINEINKLKALIVTLQQQLQGQQTEIFYIFKHIHKKTEPFQMKKEVFEEYDNYVINTPDDTCDNGSLILTHKPYTEKVNQNVVLKKETIKASELRKNDMCIVKNKIYKITAIWFMPTLTTNGLHNNFRFILYCEEDKSKIEIIYPHDFQLELDMNSYVEMEI